MPNVTLQDLDPNSFELFKEKALNSKRIDAKGLPKDKGNLFNQVEKTTDLLFTKCLKAMISYEGINRVENFAYDKEALREAVHNAIVHKDYSTGVPIQIGVYEDRLFIYNSAVLPNNWDLTTLLGTHRSIPYNPDIANTFFKAGYIESWGRGIEKIVEGSVAYSGKKPKITIGNGFEILIYAKEQSELSQEIDARLGDRLGDTRQIIIDAILENPKISISAMAKKLGISTTAVKKQLEILKNSGIVERVGKPKGGYWRVKQ